MSVRVELVVEDVDALEAALLVARAVREELPGLRVTQVEAWEVEP